MPSFFNRKSMPCAFLQGGVCIGIVITASQLLVNPRANGREILNALTLLSVTYGALGERPSIWLSAALYLLTDKDLNRRSTLPKELSVGISVVVLVGMFIPWIVDPEDDMSDADDDRVSLARGEL